MPLGGAAEVLLSFAKDQGGRSVALMLYILSRKSQQLYFSHWVISESDRG